jgi:L-asparaginase
MCLYNQEYTLTIKIFTTGGTFDKIYFDAKSEFHIGDTIIGTLLEEANVDFDYEIESLLKKDSLDMDENDREKIRIAVSNENHNRIMITHGTDTMVETAQALLGIADKTIVLFGSMQPARMRYSDALYNLGVASAAVQLLPAGVYLAMNGNIFDPLKVTKNRALNRFELTDC